MEFGSRQKTTTFFVVSYKDDTMFLTCKTSSESFRYWSYIFSG
nr:hypothetical protein [Enterococcus casseliflavus]